MINNVKIVVLVLISFGWHGCNSSGSQNNSTQENVTPYFLDGLKLAGEGDIDPNQPIMLDGKTIPVYRENGKKIEPSALMETLINEELIPDPYINGNGEIKVFVLREATIEEKEQMAMMQQSMNDPTLHIGNKAFPFKSTTIDDQLVSLEGFKGKTLVLNFWFIECKPCQMEIPELNNLVETYKDNKDVVFLSFGLDNKNDIQIFLETTPFYYQIVDNSADIVKEFNVNSFPTHIIVDKEGVISFATSGLSDSTIYNLNQHIKSNLSL